MLAKTQTQTTVAKAVVTMVCPREQPGEPAGNPTLWREKVAQPVSITTQTFTMVADVHLDPRYSLREHLELYREDFLPITNVSALWIAAAVGETHTVQRPLALLNPRSVLSFSPR